VTTQSTYVNNTGQIVTFGDSFTAEQALAALYLTPAVGQTINACVTQ